MSDPTDTFYQTSNGWTALSTSALIALDQQLIANRDAAIAALNAAQAQYNLNALQRNDSALAAIQATITAQQLEITRANLRRHALDSQFAALTASGYKLDPNANMPFIRAPF